MKQAFPNRFYIICEIFLCHKEGTLHFSHTTISVPHNNAYISPFYQTANNNGTPAHSWHSGTPDSTTNWQTTANQQTR